MGRRRVRLHSILARTMGMSVLVAALAASADTSSSIGALAARSSATTCVAGDVAYVKKTSGTVEVKRQKGSWRRVEKGAHVRAGEQVRTKSASLAALHQCAGGTVYLNAKTTVAEKSSQASQVKGGEVVAVLSRSTQKVEVQAATARKQGAERTSVDLRAEKGKRATVTTVEGEAEVSTKRGHVTVTADQQTHIAGTAAPAAPVTVDAAALTRWSSSLAWQVLANLGNSQASRLTLDAAGNLYVSEEFEGHVLKLSPAGKVLATFGAPGNGPGQLGRPRGIALDSAGNIYIADAGRDQIVKLNPSGQETAAFGTYGSEPGDFNFPSGVALDASGNIYVADTGNHRVQKLSPNGDPLATYGDVGTALGEFRSPEAIVLDSTGTMYVVDWGDVAFYDRIVKIAPSGQFLAQWGGTQGSGVGQLNSPDDLALDSHGTLYVADAGNARIEEFSASSGQPLGILGSHGSGPGQFDFGDPNGLAVRGDVLYTAEEGGHRIERYAP